MGGRGPSNSNPQHHSLADAQDPEIAISTQREQEQDQDGKSALLRAATLKLRQLHKITFEAQFGDFMLLDMGWFPQFLNHGVPNVLASHRSCTMQS